MRKNSYWTEIIWCLLFAICLVFVMVSYGWPASVTDVKGGEQGQILINNGSGQGHKGEWTDPSFLKGDKGDTGQAGAQGIQGDKGDTGQAGAQGINGQDGINGKDGQNGITGKNGINGLNGTNGQKGKNGKQGTRGIKGDKGNIGSRGEVGRGLKDQYKAGVDFRVADTKNTAWDIYYNRDFNNESNEVGIRITIKLGKSYEQKEMEKLNAKIEKIEKYIQEGKIF
jgi:hypothetical protein